MRLEKVERGHALREKIKLRFIGLVSGKEAPDVIKTIFYRPSFFGSPFSKLTHAALRGPSAWSVGERELFAAFVAKLNQCVF